MQRMNKELEDALKGVADADMRKKLQAEWQEYADRNKYYEQSFVPGADKNVETPQEQMDRYNKEIADKIAALKEDKDKAGKKAPQREEPEKEEIPVSGQQERFTENRDSLRLTFDTREEVQEQTHNAREHKDRPQSPHMDKPSVDDAMYWGVGWEKMPEPMQEALNSLPDEQTREQLQKEWSEFAATNKHYEQSAYPKQVESAADFNRTFKANITVETPPDQMRRFNGIIMDKIAEIKGEKQQDKEQVYEQDAEQKPSQPTPEDKQSHELKLTFDNRNDGMDMEPDHMDSVEPGEQDMDRDELELEF